jgi:chaperonin GroEL (HSP60 family)
MRATGWKRRTRMLAVVCGAGMVFQLSSCQLGTFTATQVLDGQQVIISLLRSAILTPIDQIITSSVNGLFSNGS